MNHTYLTLDERLELADQLDDLIEEHDAGWSVPVMEGFFLALATVPSPPDPSVWMSEAVPLHALSAEEGEALVAKVLRIQSDVQDFLADEDSEWLPLFAHTEPLDTAFTALGFAQAMEHFAAKEWKQIATDHSKAVTTIRRVADFALEGGKVTKDQFEVAEKKFMESVFEVLDAMMPGE